MTDNIRINITDDHLALFCKQQVLYYLTGKQLEGRHELDLQETVDACLGQTQDHLSKFARGYPVDVKTDVYERNIREAIQSLKIEGSINVDSKRNNVEITQDLKDAHLTACSAVNLESDKVIAQLQEVLGNRKKAASSVTGSNKQSNAGEEAIDTHLVSGEDLVKKIWTEQAKKFDEIKKSQNGNERS